MQVSWEHLGIHHTYESRAFLRVYGQSFLLYRRFSLNVPPSPPPSDVIFSLSFHPFLGGIYA